MFGDYVFEKSSAQYADNILLLDDEDLNSRANYISAFSAHGFEIVRYTDDLAFRIEYEEKLKTPGVKLAVLARSSQYIPYDVRRRLNAYMVALESLFPKLHPELLCSIQDKLRRFSTEARYGNLPENEGLFQSKCKGVSET